MSPAVVLTIGAVPEHVRTARLVALAVARRTQLGADVHDEVRLAVGEACSRAVRHALADPPATSGRPPRIEISLDDAPTRLEVVVRHVEDAVAPVPGGPDPARVPTQATGSPETAAAAAPDDLLDGDEEVSRRLLLGLATVAEVGRRVVRLVWVGDPSPSAST